MSIYAKVRKPRVLSASPALTPEQDAQFDAKLESFVGGCQKIIDDAPIFAKASDTPKIEIAGGARFIRINRKDGGVHCFVDRTNGDVLKPASYKAPAKGARGNIFDANNGLGRMQWTGPEYNK